MDTPAPSTAQAGFDQRWLILSVTTIGTFMSILDSTIVNVALPGILRDFHADLSEGQLIISVYLLSLAVVIPVSGFCADRFGIKRMFMLTLIAFTIGSALCGLAWNTPSLVFFRVVQGIGGGMLQPLSLAIVYTVIKPLERGRFMVVLGLPSLLAPLIGPTLGGFLSDYASWRVIFLINLPIGLLNLVLAQKLLKESPRRAGARMDYLGLALSLIAFPALLLGFTEGEQRSWGSPLVVGLLTTGLVALVALLVVEYRREEALLRIRLLKNKFFALGMGLQFVMQFSLFGLQFLFPLLYQTGYGLSAARTGLLLLPAGIVTFLVMNVAGRTYNRVGPRVLAVSGGLVLLVLTLLLSRISPSTGIGVVAALIAVRGLALGLAMMPIQTAMFNAVPHEYITRATALGNTGFRIFASASTAALTTILAISLRWHGAPEGSSIVQGTAPMPLVFRAFDDAFLFLTLLAVIGVALAFLLRDPVLEEKKRGDAEAKAAR